MSKFQEQIAKVINFAARALVVREFLWEYEPTPADLRDVVRLALNVHPVEGICRGAFVEEVRREYEALSPAYAKYRAYAVEFDGIHDAEQRIVFAYIYGDDYAAKCISDAHGVSTERGKELWACAHELRRAHGGSEDAVCQRYGLGILHGYRSLQLYHHSAPLTGAQIAECYRIHDTIAEYKGD